MWSGVESDSDLGRVKQCGVVWSRTLRESEAVWSVVESALRASEVVWSVAKSDVHSG